MERVKQVLHATQQRLKNEFSRTDNLDARAKQLEAYHKQEEDRNKTMDKELAELKQQLFKHSQEMFQLKQNEANLLSEINGSNAASKNLQSKIHKLDSEVHHQYFILSFPSSSAFILFVLFMKLSLFAVYEANGTCV